MMALTSNKDTIQAWRANDAIVASLGKPSDERKAAGGYKGVPLRVGRILEAWGSNNRGAVQFLRGSNGPGGLAHGGAILTAIADACIKFAAKEPSSIRLAFKAPMPLVETVVVTLEATSSGHHVRFENTANKELAVGDVILGSRVSVFRPDADVADIEYDDLGFVAAFPSPQLACPSWLAELRSGANVLVSNDVHMNPAVPGGPLVSFLDGRVLMEAWAVDRAVITAAAFGLACEGLPGFAHSGAVGSAFDVVFVLLCHKVMGDVPMGAGVAVTASLETQFTRDVPLDTTLCFHTDVVRIESKAEKHKVFMKSTLSDGQAVLASATALMIAKGPLGATFRNSAL